MEKEIKEMGTEFKDLDTTPTLTLDPFQAADKKETPAVQQVEEPVLDDSVLTEEERQTVEAFAKQIDLTNSSLILQYGAGTQKKMADFSESALDNVKSQDLGEVGALLTGVVTQLKSFDEDEEEKGFFGIFKKASNKIDSMKAKYAKAETNVNEIIKALEKHQVQLMKDTALLDKMYELNLTYFKELSMYILAGKKKLAEVKRTQLADLMSRAQASGLPEDAQAAKDLDEMCIRFEKKIHDLELTRTIAENVSIPVIASGGAGTAQHIADVLTLGKADAALAASIFHYGEIPIPVLKRELAKQRIPVRLTKF